jgi:hypothetical protein
MVSLQLVRGDHIHPAGVEGRTESVVHSHPLFAATGRTRASASHGDHRLAIFLAPIYESTVRSSFDRTDHPLVMRDAVPDPGPGGRAHGEVAALVHRRPPGVTSGSSSGRAPPR